jgi:micrococcal nuclease
LVLALSCGSNSTDAVPSPTSTLTLDADRSLVSARVLAVVDGVTIDVELGGRVQRVRYLGIELPMDSAEPPFNAEQAREYNRFLVEGKTVQIETDAVGSDEAGRLVRYVYVAGEMVNRALITNGYATVSDDPPVFLHRRGFLEAQENAQDGLRGVWKSVGPTPGPQQASAVAPSPTSVPRFGGGTLPRPRSDRPCDYSPSSQPRIKANLDERTGERVYLVPDSLFYVTTIVDESKGDRWFCLEEEAIAAGFRKAKR